MNITHTYHKHMHIHITHMSIYTYITNISHTYEHYTYHRHMYIYIT